MRATPFQVTREGSPIEEHGILNSVDAKIGFHPEYIEFAACIASGLDIEKWTNNQYAPEFKAKIMAWYQLSNEIAVHQQDAKNRKEKQLSDRANRKRR